MPQNHHRPFHFYEGHTYFLTARCYEQHPYFLSSERKRLFIHVLKQAQARFGIQVFAWVLLSNHYHMVIHPQANDEKERRNNLVEFIRKLHKDTARTINKEGNTPGQIVWYQYWDYCIRDERDFWKHFNYIIQNPLKHHETKTLEEAYYYPFSSNSVWLRRFGKEGLSESFEKFPVKDWTPIGHEK